jgi:hypothetical protein
MPSRTPKHQALRAPTPRRRSSALPLIGESMVPWLAAAFGLAALNLVFVMGGYALAVREQALLLMAMCASIAAAGLVSARSNRALLAIRRDELARPAAEELVPVPTEGTRSYAQGMHAWTAAMVELIDHALSQTDPQDPGHAELSTAAGDTRDLAELLEAGADESLSLNDQARLHALGSLWEAGQPRIEQLAAQADPTWHRRWRARTVVERRLRHGVGEPRPLVLPYRP